MSIIIKGMDMPKNCGNCRMKMRCSDCVCRNDYCVLAPDDTEGWQPDEAPQDRPDWCPLEELVQCGECKWANSRGECAYNGEEAEDIKMCYCSYGDRKDEVEE